METDIRSLVLRASAGVRRLLKGRF
jgi:hypothetical protein